MKNLESGEGKQRTGGSGISRSRPFSFSVVFLKPEILEDKVQATASLKNYKGCRDYTRQRRFI